MWARRFQHVQAAGATQALPGRGGLSGWSVSQSHYKSRRSRAIRRQRRLLIRVHPTETRADLLDPVTTSGDPKTSWSYTVQPADAKKPNGQRYDDDEYKLYPRGRLIIATDDCILFDGPNPFWHGMFPIARLRLDPWPWGLLGVGITRDLMPLQDAVNETSNGILDMVRKALRPGLKGDARAMPESMWNRLDTRIPGTKVRHNPTMGNIEFEPPPNIPSYVFEFLKMMVSEMDYHGGVANLQALTQLKQAPGADSIEQMMEALSPTLRMKGRLLQVFLRDV